MTTIAQLTAAGDWVRWIAGPIFEQELRVASRRRRLFVLRSVYVLALLGVTVSAWAVTAAGAMLRGAYVARMPQMAAEVAATVVGLQFCVLPVFAAVMLSGAISQELNQRTLGVLMTTPITGFQIVFGKLAGGLLQIVLLLACALPVLALLRAFGGVPWEVVVPGLTVTLTTTVLAGSIALWFSIGNRRAPWVFLKTLVAMALVFLVFPFVWREWTGESATLAWTNPYLVMVDVVFGASKPGGPASASAVWPWHVLASLAASAALVAGCVPRVRRAAMRQMSGEGTAARRAKRGASDAEAVPADFRIRHCPVLWHELRSYRASVRTILRPAAWGLGLLVVCYLAAWRAMAESAVQTGYIVGLSGLGLLVTAALAVFGLTTERESGTWQLLLSTPLDERSIVEAKANGALLRSLPAWLPLVFHVAVFTIAGYIHPVMGVALAIAMAGGAALLLGTGVWCAVRFRRASTAVMVNIGIVLVLWVLAPLGGASCCCVTWPVAITSPLAQAAVVAGATSGREALRVPRDPVEFIAWSVVTFIVILTAIGHLWLGSRFRAWAAKRVRKTLI